MRPSDPFGYKGYYWRLRDDPDYYALNASFSVPVFNPAHPVNGVNGQIIMDRHGNLYWGVGPTIGTPGPSFSAVAGYLPPDINPTKQNMNSFLIGHSLNFSGGYGAGAGATFSEGPQGAAEFGLFTPGAGVNYTYDWVLYRWNK